MRKSPLAFLLFLLAFPCLPAWAADTDVPALIDKVIAAYGGEKTLKKVKSYSMEGTLTNMITGKDSPLLRAFSRPDRLRVEIGYAPLREVRLLSGKEGWRSGKTGEMGKAEGMQLDSMVLQAARADLPWILMERKKDVRKGEIPGGDPALVGLTVPLGGELSLTAYVDPASGRILRSLSLGGNVETQNPQMKGMKVQFVNIYDDFRPVDGILFPFREENWASGMRTGTTLLTTVKINPKLSAKDFTP